MKKAQLQLMENIFVLIIVFILLIISFIYVISFFRQQDLIKQKEYHMLEIIKRSRVINFLPELQCSDDNIIDPDCYDLLKMETFLEKLKNDKDYQTILGNVKIVVKQFDPSPNKNNWAKTWEIYDIRTINPNFNYKGEIPVQYPVALRDVLNGATYFGVVILTVYE